MRRIRNTLVAVAMTATVLVGTAACEMPKACADLAAPSKAEKDAAKAGAEIEREDKNGNECVVNNKGKWEKER